MIQVTDAWRTVHPGAVVGVLMMRKVANPPTCAALEDQKREIEEQLRSRFGSSGREDLRAQDAIRAYVAYYKRFDKSYHVLLQAESVALKGKAIPSTAALVEAMFMAELETFLLTAGHDLSVVKMPLRIDATSGDEHFVKLNGQVQKLKAGDMVMADADGVIASVLYGPDYRTRILPDAGEAMFVVYAPAGIGADAVSRHLEILRRNVVLVAPDAETVSLDIFRAE